MKRFIALLSMLVLVACVAGCSGNDISSPDTNPVASGDTVIESSQNDELDLNNLKQGDDVSIVGQVASSTLVNGDTLWVQVKQSDESFVVYHCQLKQEFIEKAETLRLGSAVKIKGAFLSYSEFEEENTANLATLYDCEIIE